MNEELRICFDKRLLRSINPDTEKSRKSIETAEKKLNKAVKLINVGFFDLSVLEAYTCMFHAARALLYKDGIQEKSHFCTLIYTRENYGKKIPSNLINAFNA